MTTFVLIYAIIVTFDGGNINYASTEYKMDKMTYKTAEKCEIAGKKKQKEGGMSIMQRNEIDPKNVTAFFACIPIESDA
jgi:hypothetical protein